MPGDSELVTITPNTLTLIAVLGTCIYLLVRALVRRENAKTGRLEIENNIIKEMQEDYDALGEKYKELDAKYQEIIIRIGDFKIEAITEKMNKAAAQRELDRVKDDNNKLLIGFNTMYKMLQKEREQKEDLVQKYIAAIETKAIQPG